MLKKSLFFFTTSLFLFQAFCFCDGKLLNDLPAERSIEKLKNVAKQQVLQIAGGCCSAQGSTTHSTKCCCENPSDLFASWSEVKEFNFVYEPSDQVYLRKFPTTPASMVKVGSSFPLHYLRQFLLSLKTIILRL